MLEEGTAWSTWVLELCHGDALVQSVFDGQRMDARHGLGVMMRNVRDEQDRARNRLERMLGPLHDSGPDG